MRRSSGGYSARTADRHILYERSVQSPEAEIAFIDRVYRKKNGSLPVMLREDFCGTAFLSCSWVRFRRENRAWGIDLDAPTLEWAIKNNLAWLSEDERRRLELVRGDVMEAATGRADILAALNFSYFIFKTRSELLRYFRAARRHLKTGGMLVLDCYGGYEAQDVVEESRPCGGFRYIWHQASFNPVTSETTCHIHFAFPDGTRMNRAFTYDWRLWSIAEIREVLAEAGFSTSTVYWEGTDDKGEGSGVFRPTTRGEVCAGWVAYIVADV